TNGVRARARAEALVEQAQRAAAIGGHPQAVGLSMLSAGLAAFLLGDVRRGRGECDPAAEILRTRCAGAQWELTTAELCSLWSLFYLGELRELARRVPAMVDEALCRGDLYAAVSMRLGLPNCAWLAGDDDDTAERQIDEAV